ncbi:unnamed protein product [Closterium sp. NIES-54]
MADNRRWFNMRAPKPPGPGRIREDEEGVEPPEQEMDPASDITKQKVAAAKNYIEQHYRNQMKTIQERKDRYGSSSFHPFPQCAVESRNQRR